MDTQREQAVRQVLRGLTYPAEKWQVIAQAQLFGADVGTTTRLYDLPMRRYRSTSDVTTALDGGPRRST
jgi:hypothetical protein